MLRVWGREMLLVGHTGGYGLLPRMLLCHEELWLRFLLPTMSIDGLHGLMHLDAKCLLVAGRLFGLGRGHHFLQVGVRDGQVMAVHVAVVGGVGVGVG